MKRLTIAVAVAVASCAPKAPAATPSPGSAPPAVRAPATSHEISERSVRAHMEFLASDALNGRGSGTRDEWIAATYIASQFWLWGLDPMGDNGGYVQAIERVGAEATAPPILRAGAASFTHGQQILVQTLGSSAQVSGPLVKFQTGAATVPAGAIVLMPATTTAQDRAATNAAALILSPETPQTRGSWATVGARMPVSPPRVVKLAAIAAPSPTRVFLDAAARAAIEALPDGAPVSFEAVTKPTSAYTWNAVGRLTGSDPAASPETIVLSAHLDHLGARPPQPGVDSINNGADDDASGTVAVMTLAEALSKGPSSRRTVVFALFGSEESGGIGAGYFVDLPVVPLERLIADLQFEMLGRPDPLVPANHLWLTGYERSNLGAELAKQGAQLVADPHPQQNFFMRSDNIRFARRGVVAHTVSSFNLHKEYHTVEDELRFIDVPYMTAAIRSLVEPIRWLANSTFKPVWNPGGCPAPCK